MIEVLTSPGHVAAFRVTGTLTADEYQQIIDRVEGALRGHPRIGMYVDMIGFSDMTADAIAKRVRYGLSKLGEWNRFARAAVVTDKEWMRTLVEFADKVIPNIEIRAFEDGRRDEAMAWASDAG
ncbi:MAG: STAS/SEC14 domain-containing protein [Phycisphaeraceae bacterium]|nr:STAS/SEC14 domain-containing protein [Phycisphaeraceae bacterium]